MTKRFSPMAMGIVGALSMTLFYALVQYVFTGDPLHAFFFFKDKWYFLIPIIGGFGVQMWIFQFMRNKLDKKVLAVSGGLSGTSMVMCCLHHIADLAPALGLSGAAAALSAYQDYFLTASMFFVAGGIFYMVQKLKKIQKMDCCPA